MFNKKELKERKPKVKCGSCCSSQHLLKIPNSTMENVNSLDPLAEKTNHTQYSDAFKACLGGVMLSFLLLWDSYGVILTHNVRDTLIEFIFKFLSRWLSEIFIDDVVCSIISKTLEWATDMWKDSKAGDAERSCHFQITHCWLGVYLGTAHILPRRNSRCLINSRVVDGQ